MTAMNIANTSLTYFLHLDHKTLDAIRILYPSIKFDECPNKLPEKQTVKEYFHNHGSILYSSDIISKLRLPVFISTNADAPISPVSVNNPKKKMIYEMCETIFGSTFTQLKEQLDNYFKQTRQTSSLCDTSMPISNSVETSLPTNVIEQGLCLSSDSLASNATALPLMSFKNIGYCETIVSKNDGITEPKPTTNIDTLINFDADNTYNGQTQPQDQLDTKEKRIDLFATEMFKNEEEKVVPFTIEISKRERKREGLSDSVELLYNEPKDVLPILADTFQVNGQSIHKMIIMDEKPEHIPEPIVLPNIYDDYHTSYPTVDNKIEKLLQLLERLGPSASFLPKVTAWIDDQLLQELKK